MSAVTDKLCGGIYPLSIEQGLQKGEIYSIGGSRLYHHLCGFAFYYGEPDADSLGEIYKRFLSEKAELNRRFVLFVSDEKAKAFFGSKKDPGISERHFFEYQSHEPPALSELPKGMRLCEADSVLFDKLQGRVTPRFSWDNASDLISRGKGFCIMDGGEPAAWAFSAAVSSEEIDIGVETAERYRGRGLATIGAGAMVRYALGQHKRPVWACHCENVGSRRIAEKLGFVKTAECCTVYRKG